MGALTDAKAHATVAVSDQRRSNAFYGDTLGLKLMATNPGVAMFECGGGTILDVYQSEFAGTGKSTAVTFQVSNLDATMADLMIVAQVLLAFGYAAMAWIDRPRQDSGPPAPPPKNPRMTTIAVNVRCA